MRILAVDDDLSILELLPLLAGKAGFPDVTAVASGELALMAISRSATPFECLLLDINMPGLDGIALCAQVRQMVAYRSTPIIMLTAMSDQGSIENAFKAGATDYATKPFDIQELGARLRVAQELVTARQALVAALEASGPAFGAKAAHPSIGIGDPVFVDGVKDLVDFAAFRNYLKLTSSAGLAATQILAVKIDGIAQVHGQASTAEFRYALAEVAQAIAEAFQTTSSISSYAGSGLFFSMIGTMMHLDAGEIESNIQQILDEKSSEYDSGAPLDLEVSVGRPLQPHFADISEIPQVLDRAAARAEHRSSIKSAKQMELNIRQVRF